MGTKVYTLPGLTSYSGALNFDEGEAAAKPPSGPAGGDLSDTYPDPVVVALHAGAQRLPIGAIADGQYLARSGTDILGVAAPSGGGATGNVYFNAPASPNALDDEFKSGSSALNGSGGRGFSCVNPSTGATMTRMGDVIPNAAPGLGVNEYRSTLTASGMYIQAGANGMVVYKSVSGSLACYVHMSLKNVAGPSTAWFFEAPALFGVAPVVVNNTAKRLFVNAYGAGRNFGKMDTNQVYTTFGSCNMNDGPWGAYVSWDDVAKTGWGIALNPWYERFDYDSGGASSFAGFTPIAAGVVLGTPDAAGVWVTLRTFRIYPKNVLPGG